MSRPCSWCEAEFKADLSGRHTGKSHGICRRHLVAQYKEFGKTPPQMENGSFDLATLSPDDRKLLGLLYAVIKRRQTKSGVWEIIGLPVPHKVRNNTHKTDPTTL